MTAWFSKRVFVPRGRNEINKTTLNTNTSPQAGINTLLWAGRFRQTDII